MAPVCPLMSCTKRSGRVGDGSQIEPERPTGSGQANKASSKRSRAPTALFPGCNSPTDDLKRMLSDSLWSDSSLWFIPVPCRKTGLASPVLWWRCWAGKWPSDRLYCALGDGSSDSLCARPSAGNTMWRPQPVGTRTGSHFTLRCSSSEEQGGRPWIKQCMSTTLLSQNTGLSGCVS